MSPPWRILAPRLLELPAALQESAALLDICGQFQAPVLGVWRLARGEATVLGRLQRAGRVLSDPGASPVYRRVTTGTAVRLDGGLLVSFAVPEVDSVFRDATARTALNRNVRLLLAGLRAAGLSCVYWGREWLAHQRRPVAVLGLECDARGTLLLECFLCEHGSLGVARELGTDLELSIDRYRGKLPLPLSETAVAGDLDAAAANVIEGATSLFAAEQLAIDPDELRAAAIPSFIGPLVKGALSPMPEADELLSPQAIPIGWLDLARTPAGLWIGGDVLSASGAFGRDVPDSSTMLEGVQLSDVLRLRNAALR